MTRMANDGNIGAYMIEHAITNQTVTKYRRRHNLGTIRLNLRAKGVYRLILCDESYIFKMPNRQTDYATRGNFAGP